MSKILIIAEHVNGKLRPSTLCAISFARAIAKIDKRNIALLLIGYEAAALAAQASAYGGLDIYVVDQPEFKEMHAEPVATAIVSVARMCNASLLVASSSTFIKDVLPRASGLLDAPMISDVSEICEHDGEIYFRRAVYAGNLTATVKNTAEVLVLTIRSSAFPEALQLSEESVVKGITFPPEVLRKNSTIVSRQFKAQQRPDPTESRIVVSGGRAIKSADDFEQLIGGLADILGGAVGASRALVDSGIAPNSLQIGQTGKVVAPELYVAIGISGAIQHIAGMKDARTIIAINQDPDSAIFDIADFGLVADAYSVVPELIKALKH